MLSESPVGAWGLDVHILGAILDWNAYPQRDVDRSFWANPWLICAAPLGHGGGVWKAPTGRGIPVQGVTLGREVPGFSVPSERRISRNNPTARALCGVPSERNIRSGLEGVMVSLWPIREDS